MTFLFLFIHWSWERRMTYLYISEWIPSIENVDKYNAHDCVSEALVSKGDHGY